MPAARFSLPLPMPKGIIPYHKRWNIMGCRHGLAVLVNLSQHEIMVLDPLSRQQYHVTCPPGLMLGQDSTVVCCHAAVVCTDNEDGHVHGDCFSRPLKLVFIWVTENLEDMHTQAFACLYESVSGLWGDISSMECTYEVYDIGPSVLVENALCWLLFGSDVLVFDLQSQRLSVIKKPIDTDSYGSVQLLRTDDGGLGLAYLSELTIQLWERKSNCDGVVSWVLLQKTIQLDELFPHRVFSDFKMVLISGYDEDTHVIILSAVTGVFMLQLDSMQINHITKRNSIYYLTFHPYTNFYTTGYTSMPTWDKQ
ncbi:hypothetical protein CFC21_106270 [Triticum aestivum]|uniref:F-box protein AT5G49610-like beta-propeller domain-containing protein n=2 Tax=Triticum aestivum TaxID=4565 RepID=A0A9R1MDN1_WHEAT|nr:hypothetical protein CFC21_106263 [Triticum aestivum]KAF7105460.1 hypothetical protein CFC21_106270 [Triticum aestivum]